MNDNIINALETCKSILVEELTKYVESAPQKEVKCWIPLPIYTDDSYNLEGYWSQNTITKIYIDKETDVLVAEFEDYDEQFCEPIDECFNVGEIARILDCLK